jgi:hypothetical protein
MVDAQRRVRRVRCVGGQWGLSGFRFYRAILDRTNPYRLAMV